MKYLLFTIIVLSGVFISGCEKGINEYVPRYPFVITTEPDRSDNSIILKAEILHRGQESILSYGFIWDNEAVPSLDHSEYIADGDCSDDNFSYSLPISELNSLKYKVKAFLITDSYVVYGTEEVFFKDTEQN